MTLNNLARKWFRFKRVLQYFQIASSVGVMLLTFDRFGWQWFLYLAPIGICCVYILYRFDTKYGLPVENGVNLRDNPEWQSFLRELRSK